MYDIDIAYSNWILAIVFLIAIIFVALLYYRNTKIKKHIPKTIRYMLFFLRFSSVFILLFLLLEPSIQKSIDIIKKPSISFLIDQSESIKLNNQNDSLFFKIDELKSVLKNKFDVKMIYFDKDVFNETDSLFNGQHSDLSKPINYVTNQLKEENIVGAIMFSDGIHNLGELPLFASSQTFFPIITTNVGQLQSPKDISVYKIGVDDKIELNQYLSIDVLIELSNIKKRNIGISLYKNDKLITSKEITNTLEENLAIDFKVKSTKIGYDKYEIKIDSILGEKNILNNNKVFYVETYKNQKRVILLYNYISPDIQFFSNLFEGNPTVDFKFKEFNTFNFNSINNNELYILYDIFNSSKSNDIQHFLTDKNVPYLALIGEKSEENYLKIIKEDFKIEGFGGIKNTNELEFNTTFNLFNFSTHQISIFPSINYLPIYNSSPELSLPVVYAQNSPVVIYQTNSFPYKILTSINKFWTLKFNDDKQVENLFKRLIINSLQQKKQEQIRLFYKKVISKNEPFEISAKIFNNNNELIKNLNVLCKIRNSLNEEFEFQLYGDKEKYSTIINTLNEGDYNIEVLTNLNGKTVSKKGKFTIEQYFKELAITVSDSILLKKIAKNSNGLYVSNLNQQTILNYIDKHFDKTSINEPVIEKDWMINYKYLLFFIVFIIALEWFILKYYNI